MGHRVQRAEFALLHGGRRNAGDSRGGAAIRNYGDQDSLPDFG